MSLLETHALSSFYGDFQALFGVDLTVGEGEAAAIIGANGAGKSTFLRTICGALAAPREAIFFDGEPIGGLPAHEVNRRGIALVPEGRKLFPSLSVEENLLMGRHSGRPGPWTLEKIYALFPRLHTLRQLPATTLSGGQQQMVAIGRGLMSNPRLLLCDEISLGLAPIVIRDIYACLEAVAAEGTTFLLVEQDISRALDASARFYCFQEGHMTLTGPTRDADRGQIADAYFGI